VKCIFEDYADFYERAERDLYTEIAGLMIGKKHPNVVKLIDMQIPSKGEIKLVFEYAAWCLRDYDIDVPKTQKYSYASFSSVQRRDLLCGVVRAIAHLHDLNLLHNDLDLRNILLTQSLPNSPNEVRLSDFGKCLYVGQSSPQDIMRLKAKEMGNVADLIFRLWKPEEKKPDGENLVAIDLIEKIHKGDISGRMTASEALKHPFFVSIASKNVLRVQEDEELTTRVFENLPKELDYRKLMRDLLVYMPSSSIGVRPVLSTKTTRFLRGGVLKGPLRRFSRVGILFVLTLTVKSFLPDENNIVSLT